jgi:alcohol dehydrogenase YqhD (iron-dependent ADH family)
MENFEFYSPTRFVFGSGAEKKTGALVRKCGGTKVLLHFGGGSIKTNGIYDKVVSSLEEAGVPYVTLGGVMPNPRSGLVREGIGLCRREKVDFVLAVGGGSVIDSAKAIAFGTLYDGDFADFYFGKDVKVVTPVPAALPVGTVLTLAAAGSEGSGNSVITLEPDMLKRAATGDALRPVFSVLNPEFTYTLPAYQTACGAVDMFAHVVERYFTPSKGVGISDELCEGVMRCIVKESVKALAEPENYDARANLMWAGTVAHTNICGAGRIQDWASHGIEHELSALYDCAHGAGLAVVMPAWMEYVMKADVPRFARFASEVFGVGSGDASEMAEEGIRRYREWLKSLGMPTTFAELGAKEEDIPALVAKLGLRGNTLGGFVQLNDDDVANIFRLAVR